MKNPPLILKMELSNSFISINKLLVLHRHRHQYHHALFLKPHKPKPTFSLSISSHLVTLSQTLIQTETLRILEWNSICKQLSSFTSTSMGVSATRNANIPFGGTRDESQKLLDQTAAALAVNNGLSEALDFSGIEDVSGIVNSAVSGKILTVRELCAVLRTLRASRNLFDKLQAVASQEEFSQRCSPLLDILQNCDFQMELEQKIGFCIDCSLAIVLDRASEDLAIIRSERKRNMENLDLLLKGVSAQIFQAGGIDRPLITRRRSRMCVGIRASHKYLLPEGVVLNISSSGATYFMEPKEAVELNNLEVMLSNSEKAEEIAILSLLTSVVAESELEMKFLLDRILEVDLAFARAAYAQWMNGFCPILSSECCKGLNSSGEGYSLSVDIEGIQHPLLLEPSLRSLSDVFASTSRTLVPLDEENVIMTSRSLAEGVSGFPVPIDIKIKCGTRVVVISGPNTGGKTASMKTLGLASLMAKAGMYLPAKNQPKLPWFDLVLADIGDNQSLEQNLSTFSGHVSRICNILEVASKESLVLIDEIGSGTDPSEGVALSASILQYLKERVNLAVVTTHYVDLSRLKEEDTRFENAAMEFSLESLKPTYRVIWGSIGDSNALTIARAIGFDSNIIDRAHKWVEKLKPEKQQEREGLLYQSLMEERNRLEANAGRAALLHAETMDIYHEIQDEAEDIDTRQLDLKAMETQRIQQELKDAKSQIESELQKFENQLRTASPDQFNLLIKKSESAIASIIEAHRPPDAFSVSKTNITFYTPKQGEQVLVKGLGDKLATVVEAPGDDGTVLVQYGKIRARVNKSNIRPIHSREKTDTTSLVPRLARQRRKSTEVQSQLESIKDEEVSYGPVVQTSKNTVDLRGMRVEEAALQLDMAISAKGPNSVLFVIHGMGTGAVKERTIEVLKNHPRVTNYEQESPMNYGCTVAYIK